MEDLLSLDQRSFDDHFDSLKLVSQFDTFIRREGSLEGYGRAVMQKKRSIMEEAGKIRKESFSVLLAPKETVFASLEAYKQLGDIGDQFLTFAERFQVLSLKPIPNSQIKMNLVRLFSCKESPNADIIKQIYDILATVEPAKDPASYHSRLDQRKEQILESVKSGAAKLLQTLLAAGGQENIEIPFL